MGKECNMKFSDKDGNTFVNIEAARLAFCPERNCIGRCSECRISSLQLSCVDFCKHIPSEAARLMGYEVIEDKEDKPMEQVKPLKDWTLGELQEYCTRHGTGCGGCPFYDDGVCRLYDASPEAWDLTDPPRFTPEEVVRAQALKLFEPLIDALRADEAFVYALSEGIVVLHTTCDLFPSIKPGETVEISNIIGE